MHVNLDYSISTAVNDKNMNEHHSWQHIRKRGIYCRLSIYTFQLILKRFAQHDFWNLEVLLMNRMSDGHIPMATNQTWTGVFWLFWFNWQQPPISPLQLSSSRLPADLQPMFTVAATFLGYTANDPNEKEERKQQVGGGKDMSLSSSTSVQRTQCLRQHAKWILTWHMDSGSSDDLSNIN